MSGVFWLDWAVLAVSLVNTILLLWLGLTVLLNAERRTWGAWVAGGGLVLGGVFFISHSAILGFSLENVSEGLNFWWQVGWVPVVALPFTWYLVMLWYAGFWEDRNAALYRRQRYWFVLTGGLVVLLFGLLLFGNPLPTFTQLQGDDLYASRPLPGVSALVILYPTYIILATGLSLDALRRPGPTGRIMGDLARQRARPWLAGTTVTLLFVSLLVAILMALLVVNVEQERTLANEFPLIAWFDFIIAILIGAATILLGQAVVAYEIFTGKALPRRGFLRHWRRAIALAIGYGAVVSWSLAAGLLPIYSLLLSALLMTTFYALLSWRQYTERERYIDNLRPFVASQGLFDQLMARASTLSPDVDLQSPFEALCREVLGARLAYLVPLGPLAPLAGPPLVYPRHQAADLPSLTAITQQFTTPEPSTIRIEPHIYKGASWAVPLWSERGQIGLLLLGDKNDGGLYTQEEIEIAQASGERLIDTKASAEIAQRLMILQRQRLAESQLLDQRARRVLHDDVLQQLHTAMLKLVHEKSRANGGTSEAVEILAQVHSQVSDLLRDMPTTSLPEIAQMGLVGALRKLVDEELGTAFEEVQWKVDPQAERQAQSISPLTAEVLYYATREAIRNAARHGRRGEAVRPLHLEIAVGWQNGLHIQVQDDGSGLSAEQRQSGGQGLALHSTMMAVVGGELLVESQPEEYTRVSLTLPAN